MLDFTSSTCLNTLSESYGLPVLNNFVVFIISVFDVLNVYTL